MAKKRDTSDRAYLLSPQDLSAHDLIDPLMKLGVRSFKIEGRLKSAQYVAVASQTYRAAIDAALAARPFALSRQGRLDLAQTFSRGFTHGFLGGIDHQQLVEGRFPKSRGVRIGTVVEKRPQGVVVELAEEHRSVGFGPRALDVRDAAWAEAHATVDLIKPGDGVVFDEGHPEQDEQGGRVYRVVRRTDQRIELTFGQEQLNLAALALGSIVWKTDDPALRKRAAQSYNRDNQVKRQRLDFELRGAIGAALELIARDGTPAARRQRSGKDPLATADRRPLALEVALRAVGSARRHAV